MAVATRDRSGRRAEGAADACHRAAAAHSTALGTPWGAHRSCHLVPAGSTNKLGVTLLSNLLPSLLIIASCCRITGVIGKGSSWAGGLGALWRPPRGHIEERWSAWPLLMLSKAWLRCCLGQGVGGSLRPSRWRGLPSTGSHTTVQQPGSEWFNRLPWRV